MAHVTLNNLSFSSSADQKPIEIVLVHELNFIDVFSLLKLFKRCGPTKVFYLRKTKSGEKLAKLLILLRILKEEPSEISFNNFSDAQYDNYWKLQAEAVKGGKKISHEIGKIINVLLSEKPDELKKGIGATYKWYAKDVFSKGEGSAI